MSGNKNPYDPTVMFKDWIQKSGRAQTEFMKNFGLLMSNQNSQTFNPSLYDIPHYTVITH